MKFRFGLYFGISSSSSFNSSSIISWTLNSSGFYGSWYNYGGPNKCMPLGVKSYSVSRFKQPAPPREIKLSSWFGTSAIGIISICLVLPFQSFPVAYKSVFSNSFLFYFLLFNSYGSSYSAILTKSMCVCVSLIIFTLCPLYLHRLILVHPILTFSHWSFTYTPMLNAHYAKIRLRTTQPSTFCVCPVSSSR